VHDVAAARSMLDGGALEIRQVLSRQRQDGRRLARLESNGVRRRRLVAVSRTPEGKVGNGTEMRVGLDRLVSWSTASQSVDPQLAAEQISLFAESNGIMGGHPDHLYLAQRRQTNRTGSIRHEVLRSIREREQ
jgi:hypothetical protein